MKGFFVLWGFVFQNQWYYLTVRKTLITNKRKTLLAQVVDLNIAVHILKLE